MIVSKAEFHDAADIFPMDEVTIPALAEDIRKNGLQVPIETIGGKIIDGRRRWKACEKIGVRPTLREVSPADPIAYVLSLNLHRRHMTPSQRAMVGARARECYDKQAKERQKARKGHQPGATVEILPQLETGKARDQVGKVVGVSGKYIDHATKVIANAEPEVVKAVDEGRMSVTTGAILSSEPPEAQREEATKPKRNRDYKSVSARLSDSQDQPEPEHDGNGKVRGVGVLRANEAINCLIRIPKNDALRKRGFQIVTDWIKANR